MKAVQGTYHIAISATNGSALGFRGDNQCEQRYWARSDRRPTPRSASPSQASGPGPGCTIPSSSPLLQHYLLYGVLWFVIMP